MKRKILEYFTAVDVGIKGLDMQMDSLIQKGYDLGLSMMMSVESASLDGIMLVG